MITVEDYLELLVGLQKPKERFQLEPSDISFLGSIARQTFKGIPLTDRQHEVVKEKLLKYKSQFISQGYDIDYGLEILRMPLRSIDRSKTIKIVSHAEVYANEIYEAYKENWQWIHIRFPFSKKLIILIESLEKGQLYKHNKGSHSHYFRLTEKNIFNIIETFSNKNFEIDPELLNLYEGIKDMNNNKEKYVPGIYNFKLKNLTDRAIKHMISSIGEPSIETLALYKDRDDLFGLHYFDKADLESSIHNLTPLSQKIVNRRHNNLLVKPSKYTFNKIAESLLELDRFPLLVILSESSPLDNLHIVHKSLNGFIEDHESAVLFRLDNESNSEFNQYIKKYNLNSPLDKNTKVVYISNNKIPKPLIKSDWIPNAVLSMSSFRFNSKVKIFVDEIDLVIQYDENASQFQRYDIGSIEEL